MKLYFANKLIKKKCDIILCTICKTHKCTITLRYSTTKPSKSSSCSHKWNGSLFTQVNEKTLVSLMYVLYSYESILELFLCMLIDGKYCI